MVFGNCGVLLETSSAKGYVEMTGIDAETSQDIAEVCSCFTLYKYVYGAINTLQMLPL
jgi:hypothetical protein